ncbi:hypothetical protein P7K49_016663, partial [Saguinus oedipus]
QVLLLSISDESAQQCGVWASPPPIAAVTPPLLEGYGIQNSNHEVAPLVYGLCESVDDTVTHSDSHGVEQKST